ncbi:MAG: hypothetical protein GU343_02980 [Nanoarchaeota archaeon]|jgi:hypothetical protein|nr:hypothetical protein [Nanoarchaeota archaeon]
MSEDEYDLNNIIINIFDETIKWLKNNNIGIGRLSLSIIEATESLQQKHGKDKINEYMGGIYESKTNKIHIIKSKLREIIDKEINDPNKIFIGNLFTIKHNGILWPVYKNDNDIEKVIVKASVEPIVIHEIGHHIIGQGNWRACAFEFLVYFYKKELYRYPEVYEIMKKNIEICDEYIQKKYPSSPYSLGSSLSPYGLGSCFANDLIYIYENILNKDKQSPKLDIKNTIEKLKYFSEEEGIDATKILNTLLITKEDYIDINKMFNTLTKILMLLYK